MKPPCEYIVHFALPTFRSLVARELVEKYGFTQVEAAKRLGTTQAAISQYLSSKRGERRSKKFASIPAVRSTVEDVASGIASSKIMSMDAIELFCKLCASLRGMEDIVATCGGSTNAFTADRVRRK